MTGGEEATEVDLAGLRVLVVEDELLVALEIETILRAWGGDVVGPVPTLSQALAAAREELLGGAMLDVNLNGSLVFPALDLLLGRAVPVILSTGYARQNLPEPYRDLPLLGKPYDQSRMAALVRTVFLDRPAMAH